MNLIDLMISNKRNKLRCHKIRNCETSIPKRRILENAYRNYVIIGSVFCNKCPLFICFDIDNVICKANLIEEEKEFLGVSHEDI